MDYQHLYNLSTWALVIEVMHKKSITVVAAQHRMDRSQLSRLVGSLEKELGFKVLERNGRTLEPTQRGLDVAKKIEPIIGAMHATLETSQDAVDEAKGSIRFGAMPGFMQNQIVPLLVEFQQDHPEITFDVFTDDDPSTFMKGQVDLMLYYGPVNNSGLIEHFVTRSAFIPCASPDYLKKNPYPLTHPDDLRHHAGVVYSGRVRMHSDALVRGGEQFPIRFKSELRFNNILSTKAAALSGAGIVLDMPLHHCYDELLEGKLVPILNNWHVPNLNNYIGSTVESSRLKRVQILVEWYIRLRREIEGALKHTIAERFGLIM